jgi:UDP-GlcNAc:undecaprenyl-phosphate/decaprenyl-phosphate GlcNAc-1-phosphate transferase
MEPRFFILHILFGLVITGLSAFVTFILSRHIKAFDVPNERSSHTKVTPRGGGVAIVSAFLVGILLIQFIGDKTPIYAPYFLGFLFSSFVIATLSFYDDFHTVSFKVKLGGQIIAIIIGLTAGIVIDMVHLPVFGEVYFGDWAYPLTFLWILGLTNAYNFIDGLDGLAASTAVIVALFFAYISFQQGSHFIYLASLTLAAASVGFLVFNWSPAKIFMGDVGSTFLGFAFAVMAVIAARYDHSHTSLFVVPLLLFHFIFDTGFTFFRRLLAGEHVFTAHRSHLYQLLNRIGYSHKRVTLIYSTMAVCQGAAAVWMVFIPGAERVYVFLPFLIGYWLCAKVVISIAKREGLVL